MQQEDWAAQHSSRIFTWNFNNFHHSFVKPKYDPDIHKNHRLDLKNQEDLKALVWAYGGPRPSLITRVWITVVPERFVVEVHWEDTIPNEPRKSVSTDGEDNQTSLGQSAETSERILPEYATLVIVSNDEHGSDS